MDEAAWLRDLGLERYVSAFRDNDIDAEVLPKLTAEDLIGIGVTSVGHGRKRAHRWRTEACDLVAPVYSWFIEGFDTADLKEAKALLDQLA